MIAKPLEDFLSGLTNGKVLRGEKPSTAWGEAEEDVRPTRCIAALEADGARAVAT